MTRATRRRVLQLGVRTLAVAIVAGSLVPGPRVLISEQWALFNELREVAAIILGLMGVWMALLYPKAFQQGSGMGASTDVRFKRLQRPFWYTAIIVAVVMTYGVARAWLWAFAEVLWPYHAWFRATSFALLCGLVLLQLWALLLAVSPLDDLHDELQDVEAAGNQLEQIRRLRQSV